MSSAHLQTLLDRYDEATLVRLTDRSAVPTGVIDSARVDRALADADATIDAHLRGPYALPLDEVPEALVRVAAALAMWQLHPFEPDAKTRADRDEALAFLKGVARGELKLPLASGAEPAAPATNGVRTNDRERPFDPETMKSFI